jgi:hypothetical protein
MLSANSDQILFRPARSEAELEALLRLRYRVFDGHDVRAFLTPNPYEIDIDSYDVSSHHVGLFTGNEPIGYARLITLNRGPQAEFVESVMNRYVYVPVCHPNANSPLPVLEYAPDIDQTKNWIIRRASAGHNIVEPSRLSLEPSASAHRMARFMGCALVSYWLAFGFDTAVMACRVKHVTYWALFGFNTAPGTRVFEINGIPARVLVLTKDELAPRQKTTVFAMARELDRSGSILYADCVSNRVQHSAQKPVLASLDRSWPLAVV